MGHGPDFTKAIESIPGRTVPAQVKMVAFGLLAVGLAAGAYGFLTDSTRAGGALITIMGHHLKRDDESEVKGKFVAVDPPSFVPYLKKQGIDMDDALFK